ncbi:5'-AMP-activated protein kinase subunit gamma-1 [Caerostris darwini]|uniref:5'-AMP-activated protein kinase subunit gamma-1 n=1 Tax=Caerostris darwini TaxID=1538125 RepID=A0AAV4UY26_9ARAC|nr:5'-AMP-activated protein kinase subunit gamma-1 [Caerostris darwini]
MNFRQEMLSSFPLRRTEHVDYTKMPEEEVIPSFLRRLSCDDVMPTSGKIVVLSVDLLVKNAFNALVTNDIRSAPLWSTAEMKFVGMLTITDFVNVLRHYYNSRTGDIKDIENQTIATWRRITGIENKPIIRIKGSESLTQAAKILIQQGVHRLPVQDDSGNAVVFVMTKRRLLQYLQEKLFSKFVESKNVNMPSFFTKTIQELQVGTFEDIAVINEDTKVIDALNLFVSRKVSALPVLDDKGSVIDVFQKFDVFALAKNQTYHDLDIPIKSLDKSYSRDTTGTCTFDETLETVITKFVSNKFHRLVVVDKNYAPAGMISLSDVLKFLVVQPLVKMENSSVSRTIPEDSEGAVGGTEAEEVEVDVDLSTGVAHMKIGDGNKPDSFEETPETETPPDDE